MTQGPSFRIRVPMVARNQSEEHRVSSPLELLFDLTFVVAIAQIAIQLGHAIARGHAGEAILPYLMVFFAIWWAWMNFTWFASAYDTDDVPYRVLTMVQMAGVLILSAGVPAAFDDDNYWVVVLGYFVMRVALIVQWLRAAHDHPAGRATALRYAEGIAIVQVGWLLRGFVPEVAAVPTFVFLVAAELAVPIWAARKGEPSWHPHHIAERYGLFTIIVLGESVLAATTGVQSALVANGVSGALVVMFAAALVILFALWWLYFLEPAGEGLELNRQRSYMWGYGHYGVFAALAALGAGLEAAVESIGHHIESSPLVVAFAVALPVAIFLVLLWGIHAPIVPRLEIRPAVILPAAALVALVPLAAPALGIVPVTVAIAVICVLVIAATVTDKARRAVTYES